MRNKSTQYRAKLIWRALGALLFISIGLVSFQNCTKPGASSEVAMSGGNGNVYDGKLYVHTADYGICPDGSQYDSEIEIKADNSGYYLVRDKCDVLPVPQPIVPTISTDGFTLVYNDLVYYFASAPPLNMLGQKPVGLTQDATGQLVVVDQHAFGHLDGNYQIQWAFGNPDQANIKFTSGVTNAAGELFVLGTQMPDVANPLHNLGFVMKISASGSMIWAKTFIQAGAQATTFESEALDDQGLILIAGQNFFSSPSAPTPFVLKLDTDGNVQWQKNFPGDTSTVSGVRLISKTINNEFYAVLNSRITKLDSSGSIVWSKQLVIPATFDDVKVASIFSSKDGGLLLSGQIKFTYLSNPVQAGWLAKLDSNGSEVFDQMFSMGAWAHQGFGAAIERPDHSFIVLGHQQPNGGISVYQRMIFSLSSAFGHQWGFVYLGGLSNLNVISRSDSGSLWVSDSGKTYHLNDQTQPPTPCPGCFPKDAMYTQPTGSTFIADTVVNATSDTVGTGQDFGSQVQLVDVKNNFKIRP